MNRLSHVSALLILAVALGACAEPAKTPTVDELEDPVIEEALEDGLAADPPADATLFRIEGGGGAIASYGLDGGAECVAYADHIVRLTPVDEEGEGHAIDIVARPDGTSPLDVCNAEGEVELPTRAGVDTFVALDGTTLWTRADSQGRDILTGYDFEAGEEVFSEAATPPIVKDGESLTFGGPPEAMESVEALEAAGVPCPDAEAWFADGRPVAISRRLQFSFETSTLADTGEALCFVQDDA